DQHLADLMGERRTADRAGSRHRDLNTHRQLAQDVVKLREALVHIAEHKHRSGWCKHLPRDAELWPLLSLPPFPEFLEYRPHRRATTRSKKARAISPRSRRSRFLVNTVAFDLLGLNRSRQLTIVDFNTKPRCDDA